MKRRWTELRHRGDRYVIRIPGPSIKGKAATRRWHKVSRIDRTLTQCNLTIEERWQRTAKDPPGDAVLCQWCFPKDTQEPSKGGGLV